MTYQTFDEWHREQYGCTFKEQHIYPGAVYDAFLLEFMHQCAQYLSEMTRRMMEGNQNA